MLKWNLSNQQKYHSSFQRLPKNSKHTSCQNQQTWVLFYDIFLWRFMFFYHYAYLTPPPALRGLRPLRLQSLRANAQALRATSVGSLTFPQAKEINAKTHSNHRPHAIGRFGVWVVPQDWRWYGYITMPFLRFVSPPAILSDQNMRSNSSKKDSQNLRETLLGFIGLQAMSGVFYVLAPGSPFRPLVNDEVHKFQWRFHILTYS